jgi:hypothetical protein
MIEFFAHWGPLLFAFFMGATFGAVCMSFIAIQRHEQDDDELLQLRMAYHDACREIASLRDALEHPIDVPLDPRSRV